MGAADDAFRGKAARPFQAAADADLVQLCRNGCCAGHASGANVLQSGLQLRMARINAQTDDVDGTAVPADGNFDPVNQANALPHGGNTRLLQPAQIVVIGERHDLYTLGCCVANQLGRGIGAV